MSDKDIYIIGGEEQEYLMIPNVKSFKYSCLKQVEKYVYEKHYFYYNDLILIEFPAYFRLVLDKKDVGPIFPTDYWWKKIDNKQFCLDRIERDIVHHKAQIVRLEEFIKIIKDKENPDETI